MTRCPHCQSPLVREDGLPLYVAEVQPVIRWRRWAVRVAIGVAIWILLAQLGSPRP